MVSPEETKNTTFRVAKDGDKALEVSDEKRKISLFKKQIERGNFVSKGPVIQVDNLANQQSTEFLS